MKRLAISLLINGTASNLNPPYKISEIRFKYSNFCWENIFLNLIFSKLLSPFDKTIVNIINTLTFNFIEKIISLKGL